MNNNHNHKKENLFARRCSISNKGMNEGYVFDNGQAYAKDKLNARIYVESLGLNYDIEVTKIDSDDEWFFWTTWHETLNEEDSLFTEDGEEIFF